MMVCITGTPGTGKTTISKKLKETGHEVMDVMDVAKNCVAGKESGELVLDPKCLGKIKVDGIVEGHLSYLMDCDIVIVLRAHLKDIYPRLKERGYDRNKIMDNLESEAMDVIGNEAREIHNGRVIEILNSDMNETIKKVIEIIHGKEIEHRIYDLAEEILDWY
jgi:adenylate kinase